MPIKYINDNDIDQNASRIIVVHPFKSFHPERADLQKIVASSIVDSDRKPRVSYYALDLDEFRTSNSGYIDQFRRECHKLADNIKKHIISEWDRAALKRSLVFIAYGLGASLTKYCLAGSYESLTTIAKATSGVVFINSWDDRGDIATVTEFLGRWIFSHKDRNTSSSAGQNKPDMEAAHRIQNDAYEPDNVIDIKKPQSLEDTDNNQFVQLLLLVDHNFRAISMFHPELERQLVEDRAFLVSWHGGTNHKHTQSPPAPNLSAKQDDKTAQASLRRILTFLNTSPISKRSPSELAGHHYFAKQERIDIPNEEQLRHDEDDEASRQSRECPSWVDSSIKFATLDLYENFVGSTLQLSVIDVKEDMASDENLHEVAKSYIKVGKLDDADTIYEQGIRFRQAFDPYDIHLLFLHLWRAEVWYKIGKYEDAKRYFGRIQERTEQLQKEGAIDQQDADCLRKDLSWWIALTDFRLGDYLESENILGPITTQEAFSSIVQEPPSSWTENVHIIFRSKRILALNKAKMGYFDVARTYIDDLHKMLGNIVCFDHEDTSAEGKESRTRSTERKKLRKASAILKYTSALVFLLQGRHKTALSEAKSAVEELQHVSGNMSLEVLEARCLEARLLAHNDQVSKAESICEEMLRTMSPNPGPLHPVSLDFTDVLVFTLRRQARLSEALATAEGLCRQCEQAYGRDWAQTYQSKSQLASIHLANGEYRAAVEILRDISSPNSKCDLQRRLRYQAELALALLHFGQHEEAMQRIRHVILDQRSFFSESYRALAPESLVPVRGSKFEESLIELLADLQCKPSQAGKCVLHPDLVFSLETFAIITASTNIEVGTGYMEAVLSMRRSVAELWSDAYAILDTRLMVCLMKRGSGKGYSPSDALTDLIDLVKDMKQFLGPSHPITLAAHCELLLTQAAVSSSRKDLQDQVNQLSGIERQQKFEIGDFHLSTLRTRLAMFVVQLVLDDIQGSSLTCGYLLQSLHDPTVRHQSLVESLNMEEQMALAYYDQGRFEECRRILEDMVSELQDGGGLAGQVEELQLQSFLSHVRGTLKDTLATLADEENASKTSVGEGE